MYDPLRAKMRVTLYSLLACLLGVGIAAGLGWTGTSHVMPVIDTEAQIPAQAVQPALDLSDAFVNVSEAVTPAVVRIEARRQRPGASSARSRNRLFGPDDNPGQTPDRVAGGSGFII